MQIKGSEYEQLTLGRVYFRFKSLLFQESGIRFGDTVIQYPDNIRKHPKSIALVKFILASRVITDTYTLEQFLKKGASKLAKKKSVLTALPYELQQQYFGLFMGYFLRTVFDKIAPQIIEVDKFEIEEIELLSRLMEFKVRFVKLVEAELKHYEGADEKVAIECIREKVQGRFAGEFPELARNRVIELVIGNEVKNAVNQLTRIVSSKLVLEIRNYDDEVKMLFNEKEDGDVFSRTYHSEGLSRLIGKVNIVEGESLPEIYLHFNTCPFPDAMTPLGEVYIQKCPYNHEH